MASSKSPSISAKSSKSGKTVSIIIKIQWQPIIKWHQKLFKHHLGQNLSWMAAKPSKPSSISAKVYQKPLHSSSQASPKTNIILKSIKIQPIPRKSSGTAQREWLSKFQASSSKSYQKPASSFASIIKTPASSSKLINIYACISQTAKIQHGSSKL